MQIVKEIVIERSADAVWDTVAIRFDEASKWMSAVRKSYPREGAVADRAPVSGRVCELTSKGPNGIVADEAITLFDPVNRRLEIEVTPRNTPAGFPVRKNHASYQLTELAPDRTHVRFEADLETNSIGKLLSPVLKSKLGSDFGRMNEELKTFVEAQRIAA